jgi:hypothetical protein
VGAGATAAVGEWWARWMDSRSPVGTTGALGVCPNGVLRAGSRQTVALSGSIPGTEDGGMAVEVMGRVRVRVQVSGLSRVEIRIALG